MKSMFTRQTRIAARGTADRGATTGHGVSALLSAALALACAALPAAGDTSVHTGPGTRCWGPGTAPGLFDWSASPGIACRDGGAAAAPDATAPLATAAQDGLQAPRTPGAPAQITISGSAYVGIAATF
ncbi:MAG: hypothetical protein KDK53_02850 [Maritimibacter sp.]|nr:hypothetical protein [Maritimibacter sp.]